MFSFLVLRVFHPFILSSLHHISWAIRFIPFLCLYPLLLTSFFFPVLHFFLACTLTYSLIINRFQRTLQTPVPAFRQSYACNFHSPWYWPMSLLMLIFCLCVLVVLTVCEKVLRENLPPKKNNNKNLIISHHPGFTSSTNINIHVLSLFSDICKRVVR